MQGQRLPGVVGRQGKAMLALQHRNRRQFTGCAGQVAANRADHPGQLFCGVQLRKLEIERCVCLPSLSHRVNNTPPSGRGLTVTLWLENNDANLSWIRLM